VLFFGQFIICRFANFPPKILMVAASAAASECTESAPLDRYPLGGVSSVKFFFI
jgi:hypothetical protein